jgi:hypothetical protein
MTATTPIAVATAFLALALAGCTGSFQVEQTEPFRVQLEGEPQTVTVRDTDTEAQRVTIETCGETETESACADEVEVQFKVQQVASGACKILVTIQDEAGNTLETRVIDVAQGSGLTGSASTTTTSSGNATGNATGNSTTTASGSTGGSVVNNQVVLQNIVVNVKGSKNIVVVTQAQEGSADVDIKAVKASGHSTGIDGGDGGEATTSTTSRSATVTTTAGNATTSSSGNTTGP